MPADRDLRAARARADRRVAGRRRSDPRPRDREDVVDGRTASCVTTPLRTALDLGCLPAPARGASPRMAIARRALHGFTAADYASASSRRYRRRRGRRSSCASSSAWSIRAIESQRRGLGAASTIADAGLPLPEPQCVDRRSTASRRTGSTSPIRRRARLRRVRRRRGATSGRERRERRGAPRRGCGDTAGPSSWCASGDFTGRRRSTRWIARAPRRRSRPAYSQPALVTRTVPTRRDRELPIQPSEGPTQRLSGRGGPAARRP